MFFSMFLRPKTYVRRITSKRKTRSSNHELDNQSIRLDITIPPLAHTDCPRKKPRMTVTTTTIDLCFLSTGHWSVSIVVIVSVIVNCDSRLEVTKMARKRNGQKEIPGSLMTTSENVTNAKAGPLTSPASMPSSLAMIPMMKKIVKYAPVEAMQYKNGKNEGTKWPLVLTWLHLIAVQISPPNNGHRK